MSRFVDIPQQTNSRFVDIPYTPQTQFDPTEGMSTFEKAAAGFGKAFVDLGRGAQQVYANVADRLDNGNRSAAIQSQIDEAKRLDQPLMNTGAGMAGNLAGNVAALAPTAFIPGVNTYKGAALIGTLSGAMAPTATDESRGQNAVIGAGAGLLGQGLGRGIGRFIRPVQQNISVPQQELIKTAQQANIPLKASQLTGSKPLAITESVMENLPFTSGSQLAQRLAQKQAFNAAVLGKAGIDGNLATPQVLLNRKNELGSVFQDIAGRNSIDFNQGVLSDLADVAHEASRRLAKPGPITNTVDDILKDVASDGTLEGTKYQGWREVLGRMAQGGDTEAHYAGLLKKVLDKAFTSQISGADGLAWRDASRQYGNLKTILKAMGGAGAEQLSWNIPPSQLAAALIGQVGKEGKALGRGDLNQLSRVGRAFISENLPDSGTAQRQFYTNLLTGNLAGAIPGASIGYYEGGPQGAALGAVGGAGLAIGGPKFAQALLNSRFGNAYLTRGIVPISEGTRNAISRTAALSAIAAAHK